MRRVREILRLKHECGATDRAIARSLGIARSTVAVTLDRRCGGGLDLAAASIAERRECWRRCSCRPRHPARLAAQGRAGLDARPSRAAPSRRDADAAVGGIPAGGTRRLRLQPLVRALPGLGGPAVADHAAGRIRPASGCSSTTPGRRSNCSTGAPARSGSPGLRRGDGRLQLHLRRGELDPDAAGLDRRARPGARLYRRRAGADRARQSKGRRHPRQLVRAGPQPTYLDLATHYGTAILPARPRRPRDKAKVEVGVLVVERWILARLRNRRFFSLGELNQAIAELVADLNARPMRRLGVSRRDLFLELDRPALKALPAEPYVYAEWRIRRVAPDYHVDIDGHYYSVPYRLIREQLDARITAHTIELFHKGERVAVISAAPAAAGTPRSPSTCRVPIGVMPSGPSSGSAVKRSDRPEHRQARRGDPGKPAASRAGLPRLPRHPAPGPPIRRRVGWKRLATAASTSAPVPTDRSSRSSSTGSTSSRPEPARQGELLPDHPNIRGSRYYH